VSFDDLFDEREAEAGADDLGLDVALKAVELLEDARAELFGDAVAAVADVDARVRRVTRGADLHVRAVGAVLDGVAEEVVDRLREQLPVGEEHGRGLFEFRADANALLCRRRAAEGADAFAEE
jgi:hypothetical protein